MLSTRTNRGFSDFGGPPEYSPAFYSEFYHFQPERQGDSSGGLEVWRSEESVTAASRFGRPRLARNRIRESNFDSARRTRGTGDRGFPRFARRPRRIFAAFARGRGFAMMSSACHGGTCIKCPRRSWNTISIMCVCVRV